MDSKSILKVSSKSDVTSVAGAITELIKQEKEVEINVIGAGALNQAIKAVAIARGFITPLGKDLSCKPTFGTLDINGV